MLHTHMYTHTHRYINICIHTYKTQDLDPTPQGQDPGHVSSLISFPLLLPLVLPRWALGQVQTRGHSENDVGPSIWEFWTKRMKETMR